VAGISDQHQPAFPNLILAFLWDGCETVIMLGSGQKSLADFSARQTFLS
jgi:hypothetical protein